MLEADEVGELESLQETDWQPRDTKTTRSTAMWQQSMTSGNPTDLVSSRGIC